MRSYIVLYMNKEKMQIVTQSIWSTVAIIQQDDSLTDSTKNAMVHILQDAQSKIHDLNEWTPFSFFIFLFCTGLPYGLQDEFEPAAS